MNYQHKKKENGQPVSDPNKGLNFPALYKNLPDILAQEEPPSPASSFTPEPSRLLEMMQGEPVKDEAYIERQKRNAKMNALGQVISGLGQLGGVASGGDAVRLENVSGPRALQKIDEYDFDYRNQMREYWRNMLDVNRYNTAIQNDDIRQANQMKFNEQQLASKLAYDEKSRMNENEDYLRNLLLKAGYDPNDPESVSKYASDMEQLRNLDSANTRSLITSRNGGAGVKNLSSEQIAALKKGRKKKIAEIQSRIDQLDPIQDESDIEFYRNQLNYISKLDADPKNLTVLDLIELGTQPEKERLTFDPRKVTPTNRAIAETMFVDSSALDDGQPPQRHQGRSVSAKQKNLEASEQGLDKNSAIKALQQNPSDLKAKNRLADIMIEQGLAKNKAEALAEINKRFKAYKK